MRTLPSLCIVALLAATAQAVPVQFTHLQQDTFNHENNIAAYVNGVLFSGKLGTPNFTQHDTGLGQPLPPGAVGYINNPNDGNPGGGSLYYGWNGSVTLTGQVRDDLDPNGSGNANQVNIYQMEVDLKTFVGSPYSYLFRVTDDNGTANDVTTASVNHRLWIGDDGAGHRHSGTTASYTAGANNVVSTASVNLGGFAAGDNLGFGMGVNPAIDGVLFVQDVAFRGTLDAPAPTLVNKINNNAPVSSILGFTRTGTGLDPVAPILFPSGFGDGALAFSDRTHIWTSAAGQPTIAELGLIGADYIAPPNDDRSVADLQMTLDLAPGIKDVYLLIDDRVSLLNVLASFNGHAFVDTLVNIGVDESADGSINNISSLYVLPNYTDLSITIGALSSGGINHYGILVRQQAIAVPEPATAGITLLGTLALGLRRRRQQA